MLDETKESAALRSFMVTMISRPGLRPESVQTVVVKAHSILKAKLEAVKKVQKGKFRFRNFDCWQFNKVEEIV